MWWIVGAILAQPLVGRMIDSLWSWWWYRKVPPLLVPVSEAEQAKQKQEMDEMKELTTAALRKIAGKEKWE